MMDGLVRQVAVSGPNVKSQIQAALAAPKTVTPTVLEMTLTITLPEVALQRVNDELARLSIELGIPSD